MDANNAANGAPDPAPRTVAEVSSLENIEQATGYAEGVSEIDPQLRHEMIATAAYYVAEQRGFVPVHELEDWCRAEAGVDKELPRVLGRE